MPLEDILGAIDGAAQAELQRIRREAAETVARIQAEAQAQAAAARETHLRAVELPLAHERGRIVNRARQEAARAVSQAREELFHAAMRAARERLAHLREGPDYPALLAALLDEAQAQLDGEVVVRVDARDLALAACLAPDARLEPTLIPWGGVEVRSADGKIVVINTLAARLEQARERARPLVLPLFDGHDV